MGHKRRCSRSARPLTWTLAPLPHHCFVTTPLPTLLSAADAATYTEARPATLRVWRHRYGFTRWGTTEGNLDGLEELAAIVAQRAGDSA